MAYSTLPTVNANDTIATVTWGNVVKADIEYLLSRPNQSILRDNNASYTTTSVTFVAIDTTNLSITLSCSGGKVLLAFTCSANGGALGHFDFTVDGVRVGAASANGIAYISSPNGGLSTQTIVAIATVTAGSHTFQPVWRLSSTGTASIASGDGTTTGDNFPVFIAAEIG